MNIVKYNKINSIFFWREKIKEVKIPENWNELNKNQFLFISKKYGSLVFKSLPTSQEYYSTKLLIIKNLLRMDIDTFSKVAAEDFSFIMMYIDFLDKDCDINKNLIPSFWCFGRKYYGPKDKLSSSSFGELTTADTYHIKSVKLQDEDLMYKLVATLYRPKQKFIWFKKFMGTWNGDMRMDFNSASIEKRSKIFKKHLNRKYLFSTMYFYWGFRNTNILMFKNIFKKPLPDEKRSGNDYGWAGTLLELSGDKFGDIKSTETTNWFTIFVEMSRTIDQQIKQK